MLPNVERHLQEISGNTDQTGESTGSNGDPVGRTLEGGGAGSGGWRGTVGGRNSSWGLGGRGNDGGVRVSRGSVGRDGSRMATIDCQLFAKLIRTGSVSTHHFPGQTDEVTVV